MLAQHLRLRYLVTGLTTKGVPLQAVVNALFGLDRPFVYILVPRQAYVFPVNGRVGLPDYSAC